MKTILLLFSSLIIITLLVFRKEKLQFNKKVFNTILILLLIASIIFLIFTVIKDHLTVFSSPEEAYCDFYSDTKIEIVVEGIVSDMVVGMEGITKKPLIIPKSEKGWKSTNGFLSKTVHQDYSEGVRITVYQYKGTQDFYIEVCDTTGNEPVLSHNRDSKFIPLSYKNSLGETLLEYYVYVQNFNDEYSLTINGKSISF